MGSSLFLNNYDDILYHQAEPEPNEIGYLVGEIVDLARQINFEVDSYDVQELLDFHNQELTIDGFIEIKSKTFKNLSP
ncbi:hypothetical protein TNCV_404951 [Trichonephila clavipes]|nr:hypothetical protein TNCV_404951 [Trichonephila clavipes]